MKCHKSFKTEPEIFNNKQRKCDSYDQSNSIKSSRLQCEYIIKKKNRQCPLTRKFNVKFCAEHLKEFNNDIRISCPIDGRHTVWKKKLKIHLNKCGQKYEEEKQNPWYKLNHNYQDKEFYINNETNFKKYISIVENIYKQYDELKLKQLEHQGVEQRIKELSNQKHAIQQSSLIQHLNVNNLLSHQLNYIEWGCGRAELSRYLNKALIQKDNTPGNFLLIDKSSNRMKFDGKIISDSKEKNKVKRIKIDIKDFYADYLVDDFKGEFVGVSKHLCGAATDLTIRCILINKKLNQRFKGMIIAMCCRHCCDYSLLHSSSKKYLINQGIDHIGFNHLMKFTSWAVNGKRQDIKDNNNNNNNNNDHSSGLNLKEREILGLKARRIIDESRKYALEEQGFKVELCKYVSKEISLENYSMIVTKV